MNDRRTFLRQLTTLPLIGGSVALIGAPHAVAAPVTPDLLEAYKTFLFYEHRSIAWEMAEAPDVVAWYGGTRAERCKRLSHIHRVDIAAGHFHRFDGSAPAADRAALVLSAVGVDWRENADG